MPALPNARHERFAQEIVKGKSGREAYRSAGFKPKNDNAADAAASRLLKDVKVRARITELQERAAKRAELTVVDILNELEQARLLALQLEQPSAMVAASMGRAKVAGLIVDKSEHGKPGDFSRMSDDELERIARRGFSSAGITASANGTSKPH